MGKRNDLPAYIYFYTEISLVFCNLRDSVYDKKRVLKGKKLETWNDIHQKEPLVI